jgi:hypothetical protein
MMIMKYAQETAYQQQQQQQMFGVLWSMFGEWGGLALRCASWLHRLLAATRVTCTPHGCGNVFAHPKLVRGAVLCSRVGNKAMGMWHCRMWL